jgi:hypothetical protein
MTWASWLICSVPAVLSQLSCPGCPTIYRLICLISCPSSPRLSLHGSLKTKELIISGPRSGGLTCRRREAPRRNNTSSANYWWRRRISNKFGLCQPTPDAFKEYKKIFHFSLPRVLAASWCSDATHAPNRSEPSFPTISGLELARNHPGPA